MLSRSIPARCRPPVCVRFQTVVALRSALLVVLGTLLGGCLGPTIHRETIFRSVPPYSGRVDVRIHPRGSTGEVVFETDVLVQDPEKFLADEAFLQLMQTRAARMGANVLVVRCQGHTPTGRVLCHLRGYRE
ncbi:MAG: hypothetical protein D6690_12250 [Nitrospirae bacterium]|nr:MAG: hypothetical protein D6690_12250 [Nitrospirota bacterium]